MEMTIPQPTVLLYEIRDPVRLARLRRYLEGGGIRVLTVEPHQLRQPIGALLGLPGFAEAPDPLPAALEEEMLVMFALRQGMLEGILGFFRRAGPPSVGLKAVVTPTNIHWSSLELYEALRQEREQIRLAQAQAKEKKTTNVV
ncbi:MAG: DUF3783 domain-containing protein [Oscillospiraceae bacterium]|nr:DUF3783 domain-containing protein [Oscillospiraceae bacterium]